MLTTLILSLSLVLSTLAGPPLVTKQPKYCRPGSIVCLPAGRVLGQ